MALTLKFEDRMSRLLTCDVQFGEKSADLAEELVRYGFINRVSIFIIIISIFDAFYHHLR